MSDIINDPLAMPAGEIDTRVPRIKDGTIGTFIIRNIEKKVNPEKGTEGLVMSLESTQEHQDTEGNPLRVGFPIRNVRINGASGARTRESLARDLAMFIKAVEGPSSKTQPLAIWTDPSSYVNKPVQVKVGIQKEQNGFPESNSVKSWIIPNA